MKSKIYLFTLFIIWFLSFPGSVRAATYYVATTGSDTNPGSITQPWRTIQKATNIMIAGDTVIIKNGVYNQKVDLTGSTGMEGKSGNDTQGYISYMGESRDGVILDGANLGWASGFMSGYSGSGHRPMNYIKISNMTIHNFAADGVIFYSDKADGNYPRTASHDVILDTLKIYDNATGGIMFSGGEEPNTGYNFVVRNCEVFHNLGDHHGIKFSGDPRVIYNGEHIHDSIIENNLVYNNTKLGIHNSSGNYNITIRNNVVHDNGFAGIAGYQIWDSVYANNTSYANGKVDTTAGDGIVIWRSRNVNIIGNKIYNNPGDGIDIPSDLADGNPANPFITNNIIYNNLEGIQISFPVVGANIYQNTIASNTRVGLYFYGATTGNNIKNNILHQNTNQIWDSNNNTYDYNLYFPDTSLVTRGAHDISGDPKFIGGNDYHLLQTSPAIDKGINVGVTNDFGGNSRPQGSGYDIGAYEYLQANSLGDINGDGSINIQDYTLLSNAFGSNNSSADLNHDGVVNIQDYTILSNNFGG